LQTANHFRRMRIRLAFVDEFGRKHAVEDLRGSSFPIGIEDVRPGGDGSRIHHLAGHFEDDLSDTSTRIPDCRVNI